MKLLLVFQVLVAPNEKAERKIPSAPGLLLYRPNNESLLVQGKKDWKKIAMENEVIITCTVWGAYA